VEYNTDFAKVKFAGQKKSQLANLARQKFSKWGLGKGLCFWPGKAFPCRKKRFGAHPKALSQLGADARRRAGLDTRARGRASPHPVTRLTVRRPLPGTRPSRLALLLHRPSSQHYPVAKPMRNVAPTTRQSSLPPDSAIGRRQSNPKRPNPWPAIPSAGDSRAWWPPSRTRGT